MADVPAPAPGPPPAPAPGPAPAPAPGGPSPPAAPVRIDDVEIGAVQCQVGRVPMADGQSVKVLVGADGRVYKFVRTIANCLMGKVKAAVGCVTAGDSFAASTDPSARVAIKELSKDCIRRHVSLDGRPINENPIRELKVLTYLSTPGHPNIVRLIGVYVDNEKVYIVMEYLDGSELYEVVKNTASDGGVPVGLPLDRAKRYFAQCLDAINYMRSKRIAHLDLSLENAMLTAGDVVKIIDFGVAVQTDDAGGSARGLVGKDGYMSPETRAGLQFNCFAADLWCLAIMAFTCLAGVPPWEAADNTSEAFKLAAAGRLGDLIDHWGFAPKFDAAGRELILAMLTVDPARRPPFADIVGHPWLAEFRGPPPGGPGGGAGAGSGAGGGGGAAAT